MDLSVIIVNYNTRDLLRDCLRSVYEQTPSLEMEVFVVDNASSDGSADMAAKEFPGVRLTRSAENLGFAKATHLSKHCCPHNRAGSIVRPAHLVSLVQCRFKISTFYQC